ncbi:MAG: LEA type 2 family protein [Chloroflexota bacterium]
MRKCFLVVAIIVVVSTLGLAACAGGKATPVEVKPAEVSLADVYTLFGGKESITLQADFKLKNPSNVEVKLDSFEFSLVCNGLSIGAAQIPNDYYIPAGGELALSGAINVPFSNMLANLMIGSGMTQADALKTVLPVWKNTGGVLPVDAMKPVWDAVDPKTTWSAAGMAYVVGEGKRLDTKFSLTLQR